MTTDDLIAYFGSGSAATSTLGIHRNAFTNWKRRRFVSLKAQIEYNRISGGVLRISLKGDCHEHKADT